MSCPQTVKRISCLRIHKLSSSLQPLSFAASYSYTWRGLEQFDWQVTNFRKQTSPTPPHTATISHTTPLCAFLREVSAIRYEPTGRGSCAEWCPGCTGGWRLAAGPCPGANFTFNRHGFTDTSALVSIREAGCNPGCILASSRNAARTLQCTLDIARPSVRCPPSWSSSAHVSSTCLCTLLNDHLHIVLVYLVIYVLNYESVGILI